MFWLSLSVSFLQVILWLPQMQSVITIICLGVWKGSGTKKFTVHPKKMTHGLSSWSCSGRNSLGWRNIPLFQTRASTTREHSLLTSGRWASHRPVVPYLPSGPTNFTEKMKPWLVPQGKKKTNRRPESPQQINRILMGKTKDRQTWIPLCRS